MRNQVLALCGVSAPLFLITPFARAEASLADTQAAAGAIIERAIEQQGGREQVAKLIKAWRAKVNGTAGPLKLTGTMAYEAPERDRTTMELNNGGQRIEVLVVHDGEKMWRKVAGRTIAVTGDDLAEARDGEWRSRRVRFLLPLLTEKGIQLSVLGERDVNKRPATVVHVKSPGHRDVDIFFDTETGLLVKTESRLKGPANREIVLEQVFSDYKEFDGVKLATTFTKFENGRPTSVEQITELTFVDRLDPKEYAQPN